MNSYSNTRVLSVSSCLLGSVPVHRVSSSSQKGFPEWAQLHPVPSHVSEGKRRVGSPDAVPSSGLDSGLYFMLASWSCPVTPTAHSQEYRIQMPSMGRRLPGAYIHLPTLPMGALCNCGQGAPEVPAGVLSPHPSRGPSLSLCRGCSEAWHPEKHLPQQLCNQRGQSPGVTAISHAPNPVIQSLRTGGQRPALPDLSWVVSLL